MRPAGPDLRYIRLPSLTFQVDCDGHAIMGLGDSPLPPPLDPPLLTPGSIPSICQVSSKLIQIPSIDIDTE